MTGHPTGKQTGGARKGNAAKRDDPVIENRKARHNYAIGETLECGIELLGTEVKSVRAGLVSLNEAWVRGELTPLSLTLMQVHIGEYGPAGPRQHPATRQRTLLAHRREIRKLTEETKAKSGTIVPLKMYFVRGKAKVLIGVGVSKSNVDKRQDMAKKEHQRDMDRAVSRRRP
ncbi:MAG: SsrA-binding protein SmpB [Phycisphaerae bacterium]|nr:SsrA-binding protein SmpB [Phycisphaerae bacterium]